MKKKSSGFYANLFKSSFVSGAGTFLGIVPQMFVGIILFLLGITLKNQADEAGVNDLRYYGGLVLMALGCALGLGFGASTLIGEATE